MNMAALPMRWSEIDDDDVNVDDYAGFVDVEGDIKTMVNFADSPDGMVKIVKKIKVHRKVNRKSAASAARKEQLVRLSKDLEESYTSHADKEIFIDLPRSMRKLDDDNDDMADTVHHGIGGGLTMWKDTVKDKFNQLRLLDGEKLNDGECADLQQQEVTATPAPMAMRGDIGRGNRPVRDDCIVRVTNLSEETTEEDLVNLFGSPSIGSFERIFLAHDKDTHVSKGYAFITYFDRQTAEKAIAKLDRHGHDSLLLRVEWAKPSSKIRD